MFLLFLKKRFWYVSSIFLRVSLGFSKVFFVPSKQSWCFLEVFDDALAIGLQAEWVDLCFMVFEISEGLNRITSYFLVSLQKHKAKKKQPPCLEP